MQTMLDFIRNNDLEKYTREYRAGETLFLEGDSSQDIYILRSGSLEVIKFDRVITEVTEPGTLFGEMSYLLGYGRTATVKAATQSSLVRIAGDEVTNFLRQYPDIVPQFATGLAKRLDETTHVVHGLEELTDQLPDAVIMTNKEMEIKAWNRAAEKLHGMPFREVKGCPLSDVFDDSSEFDHFVEDVQAGQSLHEQILAIKHHDEGDKFVSTSTTILYDSFHNIGGFVFMSRDVTKVKQLEEKYRRARNSLLPVFIVLALLVVGLVFIVPQFSEGLRVLDQQQEIFRTRVGSDARTLATSLARPLAGDNPKMLTDLMMSYFSVQNPQFHGIKGLAVLNNDKKVIAVHIADEPELAQKILGSNYSGMSFQGDEKSPFRTLKLFRPDKKNPMGAEGVEVAYEFTGSDGTNTWLLFLLDLERLEQGFGIEIEMLMEMEF